jgi:small-conductance mechanosensitive channel
MCTGKLLWDGEASDSTKKQRSRPWTSRVLVEALFSYFILFSIAISYLYNFVLHVFFGEMTAQFIGWADSPFQTEVGFASLGFAVVGSDRPPRIEYKKVASARSRY